MVTIPCPSKSPPFFLLLAFLSLSDQVCSTGTFKLEYTPLHTQLFLDQVHANVIGGFVPGTNSPDANFGKCVQCAAIDRARYKASPHPPRSAFCQACFAQYCFDPNNLTSAALQLPGRKLAFVDPDPQGVSAVSGFLSRTKLAILLGFLGAALLVTAICAFLCVTNSLVPFWPKIFFFFFLIALFFLEYGGNVGRCARRHTKR